MTTDTSLLVPLEAAGKRLDKWLAESLRDLSRSRLKALIEEGAVRVEARPQTDPAAKVKAGQRVLIRIPTAVDAAPEAQAMDLVIAYEDAEVIVVDKPAGMVVHPAAGNLDGTLVNALLAHCGDSLRGIGGVRRPGIVHRLDKDTSGLIIAAKTDVAHASLSAQFAKRSIDRMYDTIVWGVPKPPTGSIRGAIARSRHNRKKMAMVARGGKTAETKYATVEVFWKTLAHMQCKLTTGRTHQIRVHMSGNGHPLVGDRTYGRPHSTLGLPSDVISALKEFPRQALHASTLGFTHPVSGQWLKFESPLPDDFAELRDLLARGY